MQAHCMTWLSAYFDVSLVVHGGPRSHVPCSGTDAMEVRRGQATCKLPSSRILPNSRASKELMDELIRQVSCLVVRSSAELGKRSSVDPGSTMGR